MVFRRRKSSSIILLSVLIPMSLLATFRIIGIVPEPKMPETTTVETMQWQMERPSKLTSFYDSARKVYEDDSISISVITPLYVENDDWFGDFLNVWVLFDGSISTVVARFQPIDPDSVIDVDEEVFQNPPRYPAAVANMTLVDVKGVGTNNAEAYVRAKATGSPSSLAIVTYWLFHDVTENNKDHELEMIFEVTFCSGTAYRRVTAPVTLRLWGDAGNTLNDARDIGSVPSNACGYVGKNDQYDWFRFHVSVTAYQTLNLILTPPADSDFDLELFESESLMGASYNSGPGVFECIQVVVQPSDDYFYARVRWRGGGGLYNLTISLQPYCPLPPGGIGG